MDVRSGPQKRERRTPEFWQEVRQLVERGLSLKKVSQRFGLCWSSLVHRAQREGWKLRYRGRPRVRDYAQGKRQRELLAREQAAYDEAQAALQREAGVLVFDTKKAELLAQKILAQHSIKMKVALSELVLQTTEDLRSPEVKPKDRALAMVALKTVSNQLYGWDREVDIQSMKLARKSGDEVPTAAVNLTLISLSPDELAARALAKSDHSGNHCPDRWVDRSDRFSDRNGDQAADKKAGHSERQVASCDRGKSLVSASEYNPRAAGPSNREAEQGPRGATHGPPIQKKEAPLPALPNDRCNQNDRCAPTDHPALCEPPQEVYEFGRGPAALDFIARDRAQREQARRQWRGRS